MPTLKILFFGDLVGAPGRTVFQRHIEALKLQYRADAILVNGENSANGKGITPRIVRFFKHHGVNVVTTGNHIWQRKEIYPYLSENKDLLRPANFPAGCPGSGVTTFECQGYTIGVINLQGRVFMRELVNCPFRAAESAITYLQSRTNIILVDFHAETTSEKLGLAYYLDGKVSGFVGTHTHVQTADNRILPKGTAYITDLGMAGALNSMIGMKKEPLLHQMLTQMPVRFEVDTTPPFVLSGVCIEVDAQSGKALSIERIYIVDDTMHAQESDEHD